MIRRLIYVTILFFALVQPAHADARSKIAQETADYMIAKFGRQAVREGAEQLARKIESFAAKYGEEEIILALRKCGPRAFTLLEEAGVHSKQVVGILAKHGEPGAVWVASRPKAMQMVLQHGEGAAEVLVRHPAIGERVLESCGAPAVKALQAIDAQAARRLGMMIEEGSLAKIGRTGEVLHVIEEYGSKAMSFVWEHKAELAVTTGLVAFLANPKAFIDGAKDLSKVIADSAIKPVAEVPGIIATQAAGEVARGTNWTIVFCFSILAVAGFALVRMRLKQPAHALEGTRTFAGERSKSDFK